ncbi:beta-phosphoglucomutase [Rhodanobacter sp. L36]|uniref:beta-phosphoglucomutase n=1 Tax=Rhodanobacter sp. L36 TaxID=1747221 RepID=UPI00131E1A5F|nr:beta-phosphoglucomutase [Rhodanobacter sp. L36]
MSANHLDAWNASTQTAESADAGVAGGKSGNAQAINAWCLKQSGWQSETAARDETLFALANGSLGVRGGFEESPSPTQGSFLAGVWERAPIHYHERHFGFARTTDTRVPVAEATAINIRLGDVRVDPMRGDVLDFQRTLHFREGRLSRSLRWRTEQGQTLELQAERLLPLAYSGLLCIRLRVTSIDYSGPIALESCLIGSHAAAKQGDDPRIGTDSYLSMRTTHAAASDVQADLVQRTGESAIGVACLQRHQVRGLEFSGAVAGILDEDARQSYSGHLDPGESVQIEKFVSYAWTRPQEEVDDLALIEQAEGPLAIVMGAGFDALARDQANTCASFWDHADLAIDGDAASEQALKFNLFHLFQSAGRDGQSGIAAKGLTGEGYEGHVFWDSETFVLPVLAFISPALAKAGLLWRIRMLDGARNHAREMNHMRGALYPWRTLNGDECSAHYPSGSAQYHINAAIAFAIKLYVDVSDDRGFLAGGGAELLFETARIWLQVGHFNARRNGQFCINDVTGPDEYTALVDNNYYTNRMAQVHLRYAIQVAGELAIEAPVAWNELRQKLDLSDEEIHTWSAAADAMYLPQDERLGIVAQDDTFLDKPLWDFAATPPEKYPLLLHYHPLTLYRHQVCKQADALLALVLAGDNVDSATKRRSFDYYEAITVHDSTLSASTFGVLAAEVGLAEEADRYFQDGLRVDLDDLHANTSHGAHMAAMAGSWLGLVWGFGGLRVKNGMLAFDPMLPSRWQGYRFGVVWKGRRISVTVDGRSALYSLIEGEALTVTHAGQTVELMSGKPQSIGLNRPSQKATANQAEAAFPRRIQALIFDLDGVLADTAHLHHAAWKKLASELGLPWDDNIGEKLKGVDRTASLEIVLGLEASQYSAAQKREMADRKNDYYREAIKSFSKQDLLPGSLATLEAAREAGLKIALASASRSAGDLVERMGISQFFDHIVDSSTVVHPKPDPEIFQRAAAALGVNAAACLGIEDARAGVAAIKSAGMVALGIGDDKVLTEADAVLPDLSSFRLEDFVIQTDRDLARPAEKSIEKITV